MSVNKPNTGTGQTKGPTAGDTAKLELNRKTGDWSLYKFYFDSVGPLLCVGWLLFAAGYQFSDKVPRTYSWLPIPPVLSADPQPLQRYGFVSGPKLELLTILEHTSGGI